MADSSGIRADRVDAVTSVATIRSVVVTVNGVRVERRVDCCLTLAEFLREELCLTGTKVGCELGECGSCTVLMNGCAVRSCIVLVVQVDGAEIVTIENVASLDGAYSIQESLVNNWAVQCGFCTPGFVLTIAAGLADSLSSEELQQALSGNLCRCTGYDGMIAAIRDLLGGGNDQDEGEQMRGSVADR